MKKVVHVMDSASRLAGGMFESVRGLCRGVSMHGAWSTSVVSRSDSFAADDLKAWSSTTILLSNSSRLGWVSAARQMAEMIRAEKPDIIHLNGIWGVGSLAVRFCVSSGLPAPLVVSPHGMLDPWAVAHRRWKKVLAWRAWVGSMLANADAIHALCNAEADAIVTSGPHRRVAIIPNGVDLPKYSHVPPEPTTQDRTVLFLGRIHPKKGLSVLLDAWSASRTHRAPDWRLIIAGWDDGAHEPALRAQAKRLGLQNSVQFFGPVHGVEKERLLRTASVFVLPSFSEGLPMAVLEAWSYGLPVLMTSQCNLPEGFEAGAALKISPSTDSVVAGLNTMLRTMTPASRQLMGTRGRVLVEERFSWPMVAATMSSIYDELFAPKS